MKNFLDLYKKEKKARKMPEKIPESSDFIYFLISMLEIV